MVRVASLKVEKSKTYDVAQNVVRLDEKKRNELGVDIGDAAIIRSNIGVITAIVKTAIKHDVGKNILKLDEKQRQMLGADDGSVVEVINYLDYKMEEKKLKPQPLLLKENLPHQVIYANHYEQKIAEKIVGGDDVSGSKVTDSVVQRSSLGKVESEEDVMQGINANSNKKIFCPECGAENEIQHKFCNSCGEGLKR